MSVSGLGTVSTSDLNLAAALQLMRFRLADSEVDADGRWTFFFVGAPDRLTAAVARYRLGRLSVNARDLRANDRFVRRHTGTKARSRR